MVAWGAVYCVNYQAYVANSRLLKKAFHFHLYTENIAVLTN
jgi:hypothetical protein